MCERVRVSVGGVHHGDVLLVSVREQCVLSDTRPDALLRVRFSSRRDVHTSFTTSFRALRMVRRLRGCPYGDAHFGSFLDRDGTRWR